MSVWQRVTGTGIAGSLALALLAGGCVLAAAAGPREAQAAGLLGVRQLTDGLPALDKSFVVTGNWDAINGALGQAAQNGGAYPEQDGLSTANLASVTTQLRADFSAGPSALVPLAPRSADWASMTTGGLYPVLSPLPSLQGIPARLEVTYQYPIAGRLRLVAGSMPATSPQPTPTHPFVSFNDFQVVVTEQMAKAFALRPGSRMLIPTPVQTEVYAQENSNGPPPTPPIQVTLQVTGIVEPTDPGSTFWKADPLLAAPSLFVGQAKVWEGSVIADPGEELALQEIFGDVGVNVAWDLPVDTTAIRAQAPALYSQVNQITHISPELTGLMAPAATDLTVSSGLLQPLATLVEASNGVNVLLWMVFVGLAAAGIVMMLLAARMIAARRSAEMAVRRARGASLWQLFRIGFLGAAVACVPAAALGWALAALLISGPTPAGWVAWWPGIATLVIALAGPAAAAAWQHRLPRRRAGGQGRRWRRRRWAPRVIVEVTACAAAAGGIVVVRSQPGGGDLYTSAAPLLVAVPAVVVVLRLYQVLLRGLARASARQRGVIGFVSLARAAQATATIALPAITLVLALTMAAFTIMLRDAVLRGEVAASWQTAGADVAISSPGIEVGVTSRAFSPSAVRAIAAVPGVQHAATALEAPLYLSSGDEVTAIIVSPASYAALVASTEGFTPVNPALLTGSRGAAAIPVLASPRAATLLGGQGNAAISAQQGLPTLRFRVAGEVQSTPALPAGGAFIVVPLAAIPGASELPVNLMLLTGPSIDMAGLHAASLHQIKSSCGRSLEGLH